MYIDFALALWVFSDKTVKSNGVWPAELEKGDHHRTFLLLPGLQTLFFNLDCSGCVQS